MSKMAVYTATPTHTSARHGMAWRPALLHISQQGTGCHTCMPHGSEWRMRCGMMHRARRGWWPPAQGCLATLACAAHHASTQQETRPHHTQPSVWAAGKRNRNTTFALCSLPATAQGYDAHATVTVWCAVCRQSITAKINTYCIMSSSTCCQMTLSPLTHQLQQMPAAVTPQAIPPAVMPFLYVPGHQYIRASSAQLSQKTSNQMDAQTSSNI